MNADSEIERNKALVRRFFAAIEHGDFRAFDEIVAEDYDDHLAGQTPGRLPMLPSYAYSIAA